MIYAIGIHGECSNCKARFASTFPDSMEYPFPKNQVFTCDYCSHYLAEYTVDTMRGEYGENGIYVFTVENRHIITSITAKITV